MKSEQEILEELLRHQPITGPYFNIKCSCGYIGKEVSKKGDIEKHIASALHTFLIKEENNA